jgi:dihydroorotase
MNSTLIHRATIVNEGRTIQGSVLIRNGKIEEVFGEEVPGDILHSAQVIDATGLHLIPGVIDDQVHFRDPGLTHKADLFTESSAAVAGGVTSFMEMPNTIPQTITQELLEKKYELGAAKSLANYSFYIGATNDNFSELVRTDRKNVCGIKVFMGASTGNMLVDDPAALDKIFSIKDIPIATHCEDEQMIRHNANLYRERFGDEVPVMYHPSIRSEEACYQSSNLAVNLAKKHGSRLHILHLSTARELSLFRNNVPLEQKQITAEVCVHHLWFCQDDYERLGNLIKWNPAIKTCFDRDALLAALLDDRLDVVATDHAPHTMEEKNRSYFQAPSGAPMVQHSLQAMLELAHQGKIPLHRVIEKMCHAPALLFQVEKRGFIRKGYWADLVLVDLKKTYKVKPENILYKCAWSPMEGVEFHSVITQTFVNGNQVFAHGVIHDKLRGMRLSFAR